MDVLTLPVGPLQTNCYLASCPETKEAIIVDPGDSGDFISQKILDLKLQPKAIVATHGHVDHIVAVIELKLAFNIPFLAHKKDLFLLKRTKETIEYFLGFNPYPELSQWKNAEKFIDRCVKEGDEIAFGNQKLKVIETPGHTPGGVSLHAKGVLFSGDTLFKNGVGRTDLSYSSKEDLEASLQKLSKLPPKTIVYPGHGPETTISAEKEKESGPSKTRSL